MKKADEKKKSLAKNITSLEKAKGGKEEHKHELIHHGMTGRNKVNRCKTCGKKFMGDVL